MVIIPVYMGVSPEQNSAHLISFENHTLRAGTGGVKKKIRLLKSPPSRTRCARTSCVGGISGWDTGTDVWRVCLGLVIVISNDLYAETWRALGRIERGGPLSGCLRGRRSEVLPVMAAHIRVYIKFSPAIWKRTSEWFIARVCVHMNGETARPVEAFGAMRTGMSSPAVRLLVSGGRG